MKKYLFFALAAATLLVGCNKEEPTPTPTLVTKIELSKTEATLKVGENVTLEATVTPTDATTKTVEFVSSDTSVATVDAKGVVTAVAEGTADITAKATDASKVVSAACKVTVKAPKSIFLKFKKALMRVGGKAMTQKAWYGSADKYADRQDITATDLTWTLSTAGVVAQDASTVNKFSASAAGETTIKATDADGNEIECAVTVMPATVKPNDYQHGVAIGDLSNNDGWKQKVSGTKVNVDLGPGYVTDGPQKITINVANYKAVEKTWDTPIDASAYADKNPALFIRMYIDDITKFNFDGDGALALSSDGTTDNELLRMPWSILFSNATKAAATAKQVVHNGWNNVVVPLAYVTSVNSAWNTIRLNNINNFRLYQNPSSSLTGAKIVIDQLRIIDWTEFDNCDNFDMWYDRMTDNNMFLCEADEADKKEGKASFAVVDDILAGAISNYRLEMWPGLECAAPVNLDESSLALKFWLYLSDGASFKSGMHVRFEICSEFTPDSNNYQFVINPGDYNFKDGWNEMSFDFSTAIPGSDITKRDIRKINYFRAIFTPQGNPAAPAKPYTYKIDDIRIVKADN